MTTLGVKLKEATADAIDADFHANRAAAQMGQKGACVACWWACGHVYVHVYRLLRIR